MAMMCGIHCCNSDDYTSQLRHPKRAIARHRLARPRVGIPTCACGLRWILFAPVCRRSPLMTVGGLASTTGVLKISFVDGAPLRFFACSLGIPVAEAIVCATASLSADRRGACRGGRSRTAAGCVVTLKCRDGHEGEEQSKGPRWAFSGALAETDWRSGPCGQK
jgi:hypothetical protein